MSLRFEREERYVYERSLSHYDLCWHPTIKEMPVLLGHCLRPVAIVAGTHHPGGALGHDGCRIVTKGGSIFLPPAMAERALGAELIKRCVAKGEIRPTPEAEKLRLPLAAVRCLRPQLVPLIHTVGVRRALSMVRWVMEANPREATVSTGEPDPLQPDLDKLIAQLATLEQGSR